MEITERPPTRFGLPGRGEPVYLATQQWALEPWEGEDPPSLAKIWSRKPKFAVNGSRSCAELAIVHHLRDQRWHGVWVNSFGPPSCALSGSRPRLSGRSPRPARRSGPLRSSTACESRTADPSAASSTSSPGGNPAKSDSPRRRSVPIGSSPTQLRFVELALRFHRLEDFTIIEVTGPSLRVRLP